MDIKVKKILERQEIEYLNIPSATVPDDTGAIIAMENYYPKNKNNINLSIALSQITNGWNRKCWLSENISNTDIGPKSHPQYKEFEYNGIHYYPYSIDTSSYELSDILKLCDGLYTYVEKTSSI